jgi:putative aldouronate transport system substrate-binding protein
MERFRSAFAEGLIDMELVTNKTSTAREKIFADMCGVMNYWAGPWHSQFNQRLKATNPKGQMDSLPAIQGVTYFDRVALGNAITARSKNPEGVYKYFLSAMFDHGPVQMLFTHGIEGMHYKIENGNLIKLPSISNPQFTNTSGTHIKPDLPVDNWPADPYKLPAEILPSMQILRATAKIAPLPPNTSAGERNDADILIARKKFAADIVYGNTSFDQALAAYKSSVGAMVDQVLAEMNK